MHEISESQVAAPREPGTSVRRRAKRQRMILLGDALPYATPKLLLRARILQWRIWL